jgi:hypothetical protein
VCVVRVPRLLLDRSGEKTGALVPLELALDELKADVLASLVGATATSLLAAYATLFAPVGRLRWALAALSYGSCGVFVAWVLLVRYRIMGRDRFAEYVSRTRRNRSAGVGGRLGISGAMHRVATLVQAPRSDRARLAWTTGRVR